MATPIIQTEGSVSGLGSAGVSRSDLVQGETVFISDSEPLNSGADHLWELDDAPINSSTTIINATSATAQLVVDIDGSYRLKCTVNGTDVAYLIIAVLQPTLGTRIPSFEEKLQWNAGGNTKGWHEALTVFMRSTDTFVGALDASIDSLNSTLGGLVSDVIDLENQVSTLEDEVTNAGLTLDQAYDFGGAGVGRIITADSGAVEIQGPDGLVVAGQALFADGTLGAPGVSFSSAPTIGISTQGTSMFFSVGGEAFRISSARTFRMASTGNATIPVIANNFAPDTGLFWVNGGGGEDALCVTSNGGEVMRFAAAGPVVTNETAATDVASAPSPLFSLKGQGWETSGGTSQAVTFHQQVEPVEGLAAPEGALVWSAEITNINPGAPAELLRLNTDGQLLAQDGAAGAPSFTFASDPRLGLSRNGTLVGYNAGVHRFYGTGGSFYANIDAGGVFVNVSGSAAAPAVELNTTGTGMYNTGGNLGLSAQGAARIELFNEAGFPAGTLNCNDVGISSTVALDYDIEHRFRVINETAATALSDQFSPMLNFVGQFWDSDASSSVERNAGIALVSFDEPALFLGVQDVADTADWFESGVYISNGGLTVEDGDLDAEGGFRRTYTVWGEVAGEAETLTRDGSTNAPNPQARGWIVPERDGSVVGMSAWVDASISSGSVWFWVERFDSGSSTWVSLWGTDVAPVITMSGSLTATATANKGTHVVAAGELIRVRSNDSAPVGPTSFHVALTYEC